MIITDFGAAKAAVRAFASRDLEACKGHRLDLERIAAAFKRANAGRYVPDRQLAQILKLIGFQITYESRKLTTLCYLENYKLRGEHVPAEFIAQELVADAGANCDLADVARALTAWTKAPQPLSEESVRALLAFHGFAPPLLRRRLRSGKIKCCYVGWRLRLEQANGVRLDPLGPPSALR